MKEFPPLPPTLLCIIGITGDLAKRKLLPAIEAIALAGALPAQYRIIGTTRQSDATLDQVFERIPTPHIAAETELFVMDPDDPTAYIGLAKRLAEIEGTFGTPAQRLLYLSVPPSAVRAIVEQLGVSGLARVPQTKLLLEKPFGIDLSSATDLVSHIDAWFTPEQVYRIDHYLAKQLARNLIVFREYNSLFRRTWNNQYIERIEIRASEQIGIEGRAHFYEQTGALRDVVQSHLLQLAALTLMHPVPADTMHDVPSRRLDALKHLSLHSDSTMHQAKRGQYRGYREEVRNPNSHVETFVDITLESSSTHMYGVPVRILTGKMLGEKSTEIRIYYKKESTEEANELILKLQPHEGIRVGMWAQRPGYTDALEQHVLGFTYADHYAALPDAYEKVLVDVMRGDHDFFVSSAEVLESWRILAPLQDAWEHTADDLMIYEGGTDPSQE